MDFERLERAWQGKANQPDAAAAQHLVEEAVAELSRRRRDFLRRMGLAGAALAACTLVAGWGMVGPGQAGPRHEWGALAMLAVSWGLFAAVMARFRRQAGRFPDPGRSLPGNLSALLAENEDARRRLRLLGLVVPVFILALGVALSQMIDNGKMSPRNVRDFMLLAGTGFTLAGGILGWRYWRVLSPEGARLRRLLDQYREG